MKKQIPLSVPKLSSDIIENLKECIETGWVSTGGRFISEFEKKVAAYVHMESAVSVQSGTAGLHLALKEMGVQSGDEVIVPTLTFIAAVNPIRYLGAAPIFMDCDNSLCIDVDKLEQFLESKCELNRDNVLINKSTGKRIKAVIAVHIFGNMCNMEKLMSLALKYHFYVLEDATEALGSYMTQGMFQGCFAGTIGDIGVFSFNANKIITTGGGGMIVSRSSKFLERMRHLSITAKTDSLYFIHDEVGYNYRMLNIQAALGVSQMDELEEFIEIKTRNYEKYKTEMPDEKGIRLLPFLQGIRANYWFYSFLIDETVLGIGRDELMCKLIEEGVQCRPIWRLIHTLEPYKNFEAYRIDKATYYESHILNVPCSTSLKSEEVTYICNKIKEIAGL